MHEHISVIVHIIIFFFEFIAFYIYFNGIFNIYLNRDFDEKNRFAFQVKINMCFVI